MSRLVFIFIFTGWMILGFNSTPSVLAVDADGFSEILKKIDKLVCANPEKISQYYSSELCLLYTSPSPRDGLLSRMPSSA